jgi:hypothetical protein
MGGRDQSERLVAINRNQWSQSAGARNDIVQSQNGAPRPTKMGTTLLLWRYDVVRRDATESETLRYCFRQQPSHDFRVTFDC